jgi:hypothetical protein
MRRHGTPIGKAATKAKPPAPVPVAANGGGGAPTKKGGKSKKG